MTRDPGFGTRDRALWAAAVQVLRANDLGGWTVPAPGLYPHQWSWDSAFVAIGLAYLDPDRALRELESLFAAQWTDGRVPHIVYNPAAPPQAYFPDAARWACTDLTPLAPQAPASSGLIQPPVHAFAAWRIFELSTADDPARLPALRSRLAALYPKLLAWHRYLATARDPEASGLITIYHPWESGTDNSPRWDLALANVEVGAVPPYLRRDLQHVADSSHRPTDAEYDRYLWLIESLKAVRYDDAAAHQHHPFLIKDVLASAIFALACEALGKLAVWLDRPRSEQEQLATWAARSAAGVRQQLDADERLALDLDLRLGQPVRVRTVSGFAPLLLPDQDPAQADLLAAELFGPQFAGAPGLAFPVVPSAAIDSTGYSPRTYWRGPTWPFINWLLWWSLGRLTPASRWTEPAAGLRLANLALLDRPDARFAEYFEPFTAEPLGALNQSWTAAVTLDWLATPA